MDLTWSASEEAFRAEARGWLEQNLAELGYTGFTVDDTYDSATAKAVSSWQADLGLPETGVRRRPRRLQGPL